MSRRHGSAALFLVLLFLATGWSRSLPPVNGALPCAAHVVLYDRVDAWSPAALDALLEHYALIVVNERNYAALPSRRQDRCLLYFDPYGKWEGSYSSQHKRYPVWQPGPGDLEQPRVILNGSVACYTWDEDHADRFVAWVDAALAARPRVAGIFLDDWSPDRSHWAGSDADKRRVWPGWPDSAVTGADIHELEARILAAVRARLGEEGLLVCNGTARHLPGVRRMAEDVGRGRETWANLLAPGNPRELRPGDLIQLRGLAADGTLARADSLRLARAIAVAAERDCSVGLAYREAPEGGGSLYQLPRGRLADPRSWLSALD